jgi:hypothetical protein
MLAQQMNAAPPSSTPNAVPELGHLKAAAERISQANYNLLAFISRFHGPMPDGASGTTQGEPIPCYKNDLTSVFDQISQLETLVSALSHIG